MKYVASMQPTLRIDAFSQTEPEENVGFVTVVINPEKFFVEALQVAPEYRHQGVGRRLLKSALGFIVDEYVSGTPVYIKPEPYLDQPMSREELVAFYSQFGFVDLNDGSGYMVLQLPKISSK